MFWWKCLITANLISIVVSVPLEPGQPGGPWTQEEIDIVRDKVTKAKLATKLRKEEEERRGGRSLWCSV